MTDRFAVWLRESVLRLALGIPICVLLLIVWWALLGHPWTWWQGVLVGVPLTISVNLIGVRWGLWRKWSGEKS